MRTGYAIELVLATPEYILASLREEWRQCALSEGEEAEAVERQLPSFTTTVHEWREALDLVGWKSLGQALNESWGTQFSRDQWFQVLEPAREKTLRDVCELLATQARRPLVPPARILGCECATAGVFLAIRSLLVQAGASPGLRPSTPLAPFLEQWPEVFQQQISRLAPGGLPLMRKQETLTLIVTLCYVFAALLVLLGLVVGSPWPAIGGAFFYGLGWTAAGCGRWFADPVTLASVTTFRDLTEAIVEQQSRTGFGPVKSL
ncbi:MAG TPA: hypothetical protein VI136_09690 [Verrucomicrobiae bacterium]